WFRECLRLRCPLLGLRTMGRCGFLSRKGWSLLLYGRGKLTTQRDSTTGRTILGHKGWNPSRLTGCLGFQEFCLSRAMSFHSLVLGLTLAGGTTGALLSSTNG